MLLKLWIKGFRNLKEVVIDFKFGRPFVIFGENNQGKTNFLESIYVLIHGASTLDDKVENWVSLGEKQALLGADFIYEGQVKRLYTKVTDEGKKWGTLEGKPLKSYKALKPILRAEFISSDVIRIFKESPEYRRKELDKFCSAYFPEYGIALKKYERLIKQKNAALKQLLSPSQIQFWNTQLILAASVLIPMRIEALNQIKTVLSDLLNLEEFPFLQEQVKTIALPYKFSWNRSDVFDLQSLEDKLQQNIHKELQVGHSLYGPHRDDFEVIMNGKNLFDFYSRGVNRLVAVLLKLAQLQLIEQREGIFPLLLLDDTFSEIDPVVKQRVVSLLEKKKRALVYTSVLQEDHRLFTEPQVFKMQLGNLHTV